MLEPGGRQVEHKECNTMTCSASSFINEQRGRVTKRLNKDTEHHREVRHTELDDGQKVVTSETKCLHFDTISNCTPSDTSCTSPSNDRLQCSPTSKNLAAHAIAHRATLYFTSIQTSFTLSHDIHFKVSRIDNGNDIKTPSLIVARRTRAAAVYFLR